MPSDETTSRAVIMKPEQARVQHPYSHTTDRRIVTPATPDRDASKGSCYEPVGVDGELMGIRRFGC
jgi:hypothetical protein